MTWTKSSLPSRGDPPYDQCKKKVELAVHNVVHGKLVAKRDALANPNYLNQDENLDELKQ
jgi:hypothetical protein